MPSAAPFLALSTRSRAAIFTWLKVAATAILLLTLFGVRIRAADAPAPAPTPDPTALFNEAITNFNRGNYEGALSTIDTLLKQIPADLTPDQKVKLEALLEPMYFTRGAAYFDLKQYGPAVSAIQDYITRYPKSPRLADATFSLAQANYFNKDFPAAAQGFASLEGNQAMREQALLLEGLSYKEAADNPKAITALEKLTANGIRSPTAARGGMQLVIIYGRNKQPEKGLKMLSLVQANIDQLENVVELNSVAVEQGDAYLENNSNKEALICYRAVRTKEQVIAIEQDRSAALQKRLDASKIAAQAAARVSPANAVPILLAMKQVQDSLAEDQQLVDSTQKLPTFYPKILYRIGRAFYQMPRPWESIVAYQDSYDRSQDPADREPALYGVITAYADVSQAASAREACNQYLKEFPQGTNAFSVGYLLGATALQENDPVAAESYFGRMLKEQPASTMREEMRFLLANAQFAQNKYDEAKASYAQYMSDYPQGTHFEEASYRIVLTDLFAGNYDAARHGIEDYLGRYPTGTFVSDARYRRAVCDYAEQKYAEVLSETQSWLKDFPGDVQQGEVEALVGDAYTATGKEDEALAAYQISFKTAATDEVLNYSLMEAGKILQKRRDWEADAAMFADFVKTHPDHPTLVAALSEIGRAKAKEGKVDEAKQFLADTLKKYIDDPHKSAVEQILDQLASLCVRKKRPAVVANAPAPAAATSPAVPAGPGAPATVAAAATPEPTPEETPEPDPGQELDTLLGSSLTDQSPTARARILYAKAQLARLRRKPETADKFFLEIAAKFKPGVLSPTILGLVGDALVSSDKLKDALPFYQTLLDDYPKNENVDFAYNGLGEIAFRMKQYDKALQYFQDGLEKAGATQKLKDLTVGKGKALLALGKLPEAKKIFEQSASVREWRGETTAFCVYSLGEIEARQGHWAEANAYYQRVFVGYQRFLPWVAKAYLGSADCLEKLGKKEDAVKTYQEMLRNDKLADFSETAEARQRLQALGGAVPPAKG